MTASIDESNLAEQHAATIAMFRPEFHDIFSFSQYPWMCINFFLVLCAIATFLRMLLVRKSKLFVEMEEGKKRNVPTYAIEIVFMTFALAAQIYGGRDVLFRGEDTTSKERVDWMVLSIQTIAVVYAWELAYRIAFGWPLLLHHLVTMALIQLVVSSMYESPDVMYLRYALLVGFNATTEQTSFVSLLLYRFEKFQAASAWFWIAAVQSFLLKTAVFVGSLTYYGIEVPRLEDENMSSWDKFWRICFVPLIVLLYASQLYAAVIMMQLALRSANAAEKDSEIETEDAMDEEVAITGDGAERDLEQSHEIIRTQVDEIPVMPQRHRVMIDRQEKLLKTASEPILKQFHRSMRSLRSAALADKDPNSPC